VRDFIGYRVSDKPVPYGSSPDGSLLRTQHYTGVFLYAGTIAIGHQDCTAGVIRYFRDGRMHPKGVMEYRAGYVWDRDWSKDITATASWLPSPWDEIGFDLGEFSRNSGESKTSGYRARVPFWCVCGALAIHPIRLVMARHKRERRRSAGLCVNCGYDIRASPTRCPECAFPFEVRHETNTAV
jgi:hypothetical protein